MPKIQCQNQNAKTQIAKILQQKLYAKTEFAQIWYF